MIILDRILAHEISDLAAGLELAGRIAIWIWRTVCVLYLAWFALAVLVPWLGWIVAH